MTQAFTGWNNLPTHLERKIGILFGSQHELIRDKDLSGNELEIYSLSDYNVAHNVPYLTDAQKIKLFDIAADHSIILSNFLHALTFEIEVISIGSEVFKLPGIVVGTWPHCNLFGGMDENGDIHT